MRRPMLEGERIVLRTIKTDDIDTIFELTRKYPDMGDIFPVSLLHELIVEKHFEPGDSSGEDSEACLLITDKSGTIMGSIAYMKGLRYIEGLELAYHIFRPIYRAKGYMSEALQVLMNYLFVVKKIPRLQINLEKGNTGSRKVAEKCGFTYDGAMRKALLSKGKWKDIEMFSLLREEWEKLSR
jgi:RimJ/RimL family protein N-acetyltransferase